MGSSSDAATTFDWAEIDCSKRNFRVKPLRLHLAADLGSDVPFFIYQSAAIIRGRGERGEPIAFPHELPLLLLKPPLGVPTPWAYQHWRDSREVPGVSYAAQNFTWGSLVNDLERPVFEKYLFLAELKTWLLEQVPEVAGALMSGSEARPYSRCCMRKAAPNRWPRRVAAEFGHPSPGAASARPSATRNVFGKAAPRARYVA